MSAIIDCFQWAWHEPQPWPGTPKKHQVEVAVAQKWIYDPEDVSCLYIGQELPERPAMEPLAVVYVGWPKLNHQPTLEQCEIIDEQLRKELSRRYDGIALSVFIWKNQIYLRMPEALLNLPMPSLA